MLFPIIAVMSWGAVAKASVVLALATLYSSVARQQSAASRHFVWCLALSGIVGILAVSQLAPSWDVAILPGVEATIASSSQAPATELIPANLGSDLPIGQEPNASEPSNVASLIVPASQTTDANHPAWSIQNWIAIVWLVGFVLCIAPVIIGLIRIEFLGKSCRPINDQSALKLLSDCCQHLKVNRTIKFLEL